MLSDTEWLELGKVFANAKDSTFEFYRQKELQMGITKSKKYYMDSFFVKIAGCLDEFVCSDRSPCVTTIGDRSITQVFYGMDANKIGDPFEAVRIMVEDIYSYLPRLEKNGRRSDIADKLRKCLVKLHNRMDIIKQI